MAHAQKPDFVFRTKRPSPFKSAGVRQFSRLLAAEVCALAVVMLDKPCSEVVRRVLASHCIRQFHLDFPSRASPFAITFQLECTPYYNSHISKKKKLEFSRPYLRKMLKHQISLRSFHWKRGCPKWTDK